MSIYEKGMTELVGENKSLKAELLDTTNQLKALKESFNELEQYSRRDCLEVRVFQRVLVTRGKIRMKLLLKDWS